MYNAYEESYTNVKCVQIYRVWKAAAKHILCAFFVQVSSITHSNVMQLVGFHIGLFIMDLSFKD